MEQPELPAPQERREPPVQPVIRVSPAPVIPGLRVRPVVLARQAQPERPELREQERPEPQARPERRVQPELPGRRVQGKRVRPVQLVLKGRQAPRALPA